MMIRGRCPICGRALEIASLDDLPSFPFCSERCRLIDLGRWIDGAYALPGSEPATPEPETPRSEGEDESL
jgi:endogenous inhibitor of DNA gyrase (YacG/DUF329 family)